MTKNIDVNWDMDAKRDAKNPIPSNETKTILTEKRIRREREAEKKTTLSTKPQMSPPSLRPVLGTDVGVRACVQKFGPPRSEFRTLVHSKAFRLVFVPLARLVNPNQNHLRRAKYVTTRNEFVSGVESTNVRK